VVCASEGIQPQTIEAINHAKEAEVPIIVAFNKIDLPGANVELISQELSDFLDLDTFGGDTFTVPISAIEGTNI
jgi:translation initiation factor IF-2